MTGQAPALSARTSALAGTVTRADPLAIDATAEAGRIAGWIGRTTAGLRRRGLVVALSGGIDSSVCAALAVRALGPGRVLGLSMPERESDPVGTARAAALAAALGIELETIDLTRALAAAGCYRDRDSAIRRVLPAYGDGWRSKIVLAGGPQGGISHFRLVAEAPDGTRHEARLPLTEYLAIVAATSLKQRLRKTMEYTRADGRNLAVVGTPNRLEVALGFFVRNGDGSADLKPIAHLYKSQVYALARELALPADIQAAIPTTDTYSLAQGQDEFYFGLPWPQMDRALLAFERGHPAGRLAADLGLTPQAAEAVLADIGRKRRLAAQLAAPPLTMDAGPRDGELVDAAPVGAESMGAEPVAGR